MKKLRIRKPGRRTTVVGVVVLGTAAGLAVAANKGRLGAEGDERTEVVPSGKETTTGVTGA